MQNLWNGRIYQMFQLPQDHLRKEGYLKKFEMDTT